MPQLILLILIKFLLCIQCGQLGGSLLTLNLSSVSPLMRISSAGETYLGSGKYLAAYLSIHQVPSNITALIPQTCHFLLLSPKMTTQSGQKCLMKSGLEAPFSYLLWEESIWLCGGLIVTEVTGGGGGGVLGLYRGYLDLRSVLEIRPESVQCTVTCTPATITDIQPSHWILSVGLYRGFIKSTVYRSCPILERSPGIAL